eukprot:3704728-Rhodomonas_salina.1
MADQWGIVTELPDTVTISWTEGTASLRWCLQSIRTRTSGSGTCPCPRRLTELTRVLLNSPLWH